MIPRKIVIFETNPASPVFDNTPAHASWFETIIREIKPDAEIYTYRVVKNEFPDTLDNVSGLIITGSSKEVYDGEPWIHATGDWIHVAQEKKIPTLGVCFGSQLIAQVEGGIVTKNPMGREVGTCSVRLVTEAQNDPLFKGLPTALTVQQSHQSAMVAMPQNAEVLAENEYGVQAYRIKNESMWGVQFHPEVSTDTLRKVLEFRRPILEQEGIDVDQKIRTLKSANDAQRILKNFLNVVYDYPKS